jgi:hypothetical protein
MSVTQKLERLVVNIKQDETTKKFQQQYAEMLKLGLIQRKGYNLAGINVIGRGVPSSMNARISEQEINLTN